MTLPRVVLFGWASMVFCCNRGTLPKPLTVFGLVKAIMPEDTVSLVRVEFKTGSPLYLRIGHGLPVTVREADGRMHSATYAEILVGDSIEADRTAAELRSFPPQYTATRVVVQRR
jgi:hypothetical protein